MTQLNQCIQKKLLLLYCRLRHVFVDERRSSTRAEGPLDSQAAMAMGNTEAAWDTFYDRMYQRREMAAGIDAMGPWRQSMLQRAIQDAVTVKPEPGLAQPARLEEEIVIDLESDVTVSEDEDFLDCEM